MRTGPYPLEYAGHFQYDPYLSKWLISDSIVYMLVHVYFVIYKKTSNIISLDYQVGNQRNELLTIGFTLGPP